MALSQAYLEWEKQTERRGQGQERQSAIRSLMQLRYGAIDDILESLIPQLSALSSEDYTRLLLELSREDLIVRREASCLWLLDRRRLSQPDPYFIYAYSKQYAYINSSKSVTAIATFTSGNET